MDKIGDQTLMYGANGASLEILGTVVLIMHVADMVIPYMIWGQNFLKATKASINFETETLTMQNTLARIIKLEGRTTEADEFEWDD